VATEHIHVPVDNLSPFPPSPRVLYRKNPLIEVVCQVHFPAILRVDVEPPAAFQEKIRDTYPVLNDKTNKMLALPPNLPSMVADLLRSSGGKQNPAYDFVSADGKWTIGLTREFLALSTTAYRSWKEFKAHFEGPLQAFVQEYAPAWFSRAGLRYRDFIRPSILGLSGRPWSELLRPHVTGLLAPPGLHAESVSTFTQAIIHFPGTAGKLHLQYGLAQAADNNETCYLIDSDFFSDQETKTSDVYNKLDFFNQQSGRLFRWCIQDVLHEAMEPESDVAMADV
jgi:uncharacterized protein (TIGR04255 family)